MIQKDIQVSHELSDKGSLNNGRTTQVKGLVFSRVSGIDSLRFTSMKDDRILLSKKIGREVTDGNTNILVLRLLTFHNYLLMPYRGAGVTMYRRHHEIHLCDFGWYFNKSIDCSC